ncbi:MAG: hypothetical protein IJR20_04180 [Muribaculaceae bacterium]|nr:hypothetical protein [Muribaculaceae bacterium]
MNRFLLQIRFIALALLLSTASTVVAQIASSPQSLDDVIYNPAIKDGKARHAIGEYQMKQAKILSEDRNLNVMTLRNTEVIVVTIPADLLFEPNETELSRDAELVLLKYCPFLRTPGFYHMAIAMYHDNSASEQYSKELTNLRVQSVYDWFAENANVKDLYKFSFGNSNALLPNNSMQNRRLNRRLEIYLVPGQLMIDQAKKNLLK